MIAMMLIAARAGIHWAEADLMLENGLKKAFSDFLSVLSARQQPHLHIFTLDLVCNQPVQGDLGVLPVHCDVGGRRTC